MACASCVALCLILVLHSTGDVDGVSLAQNKTSFSALLAFGDSILDTGNNNYIFTLARCNFPPYGRDFPGGNPTGRFGNGKVFSDLLVEALGIKPLLPPYLDPNLQSEDLETGVSFASGGSGLDVITVEVQNTLSIDDQLNMFKEYVERLERTFGREKAKTIVSDSLILVSMGNNDIGLTYLLMPYLFNNISAYTTQLVNSASYFVKELHKLGVRKLAYLSILPIGYLPAARTLAGGFLRKHVDWLNHAAVDLNSKLEDELNHLRTDLPGTKIVYIDIYNPVFDIIQNPNKYGFYDSTRGCCGTGLIEIQELCNEFNPFTCWNSSNYVFWDVGHPSERAYQTIMPQVVYTITHQFLDM